MSEVSKKGLSYDKSAENYEQIAVVLEFAWLFTKNNLAVFTKICYGKNIKFRQSNIAIPRMKILKQASL